MESLEKNLIKVKDWEDHFQNLPEKIVSNIKEYIQCSISVGLGKNQELGYFVLCTQGQGGFLIWSERDGEKNDHT